VLSERLYCITFLFDKQTFVIQVDTLTITERQDVQNNENIVKYTRIILQTLLSRVRGVKANFRRAGPSRFTLLILGSVASTVDTLLTLSR